jgi:hypothetical protein
MVHIETIHVVKPQRIAHALGINVPNGCCPPTPWIPSNKNGMPVSYHITGQQRLIRCFADGVNTPENIFITENEMHI